MEHSRLGTENIIAAANMDTEIVLPKRLGVDMRTSCSKIRAAHRGVSR